MTVALKETPESLWDEQYRKKLIQTLLSQIASQSVNLTQIAIRSCGYLLQYLLINEEPIPPPLVGPFVRVSLTIFQGWTVFYLRSFLDNE